MLRDPATFDLSRPARNRQGPRPEPGVLLAALRAKAEAGLPVMVRPLARVIGISATTLYSQIAAGQVRATRVSQRRLVIPAHEARRLLDFEGARAPG